MDETSLEKFDPFETCGENLKFTGPEHESPAQRELGRHSPSYRLSIACGLLSSFPYSLAVALSTSRIHSSGICNKSLPGVQTHLTCGLLLLVSRFHFDHEISEFFSGIDQ